MEKLSFHTDKKKTKLELDLENYSEKIKTYNYQKLEHELDKLNKKLNVQYINANNYDIITKDISDNAQEKNRLYMRKMTSETAKWIGYAIKEKDDDFSSVWNLINATFASRTINPDYSDVRLALDEGVSFMDTLSLEGLKMYKKFMVSIANSVLFDNKDFDQAVKNAKNFIIALNERFGDDHYYSDTILTKNWQTYYKYTMQQKSVKDYLKICDKNNLFIK